MFVFVLVVIVPVGLVMVVFWFKGPVVAVCIGPDEVVVVVVVGKWL